MNIKRILKRLFYSFDLGVVAVLHEYSLINKIPTPPEPKPVLCSMYRDHNMKTKPRWRYHESTVSISRKYYTWLVYLKLTTFKFINKMIVDNEVIVYWDFDVDTYILTVKGWRLADDN